MAFWLPRMADPVDGGFRVAFDEDGIWQGPEPKGIMPQSRCLWFLSRLLNSPYGTAEHEALAQGGFDFLLERLWDEDFGGFYWSVACDEDEVLRPEKHMFGQTMALYALAEYGRAVDDGKARALSQELFALVMDIRGPDGGWPEWVNRDWSCGSRQDLDHAGWSDPNLRAASTHQHLLEALTGLYRWEPDPRLEATIRDLMVILTTALTDHRHAAGRMRVQPGWDLIPRGPDSRTKYGNDVETVWMITDACHVLDIPLAPLLPQLVAQFDAAVRHGYDRNSGGLYLSGYPGATADRKQKVWWVQAECLLAALHLYRETGKEIHGAVFLRTLDWIVNHQVDWQTGSWYPEVQDLRPSGFKGSHWKAMYHTGRAMLDGIAILDDLTEPGHRHH